MPELVVMDKLALDKMLRDPSGPVIRRTMIFADKVKVVAIAETRAEFTKGFMAERIVKRYGNDSRSAYVDIGTNRARTRPHGIDGNPLLVFFWPKAGRVMYLRHVNHPGSDMGPWIRKTLFAAVLKLRGQF